VGRWCQKLKRGKASDYDSLTAEHLNFALDDGDIDNCVIDFSLILIIVKLCNKIITSGYVPDGFGCGLSIPIPNIDDFRLITICPILSKVFEHCIMSRN